jgi:hypothetical protein
MLGVFPGGELFRIDRSEARPPPIVPTQFPTIDPIDPIEPAAVAVPPGLAPVPVAYAAGQPLIVRPITVPIIYAAASSVPAPYPTRLAGALPAPAPQFYSPIPALDEWPLSRIAATSLPPLRQSTVIAPAQSIPVDLKRSGIDRVQLTAWALLRAQQGGLGPSSLASGGQLGGSQAGARLSYNFTRLLTATLRTTSDVGQRGGEVAAGVRIQPVAAIPLWLTAERRQRIGSSSGRNAFALFFESGLYERSLPWRLSLDAYLQGGVVGFHSRDGFIDGGLTVSRPVYRQFSAGLGVWGGAQPGIYRVDAGPRITMRVKNNMKVHFDYRARLTGNARPGSGPAVTLAGDF